MVSPTDAAAQTSLFKRLAALQYDLTTAGSPADQREKPKAGTSSDKIIPPDSAAQKSQQTTDDKVQLAARRPTLLVVSDEVLKVDDTQLAQEARLVVPDREWISKMYALLSSPESESREETR